MTVEDADYLIEEVWRNRSAISGSVEHLVLTRWDRTRPPGMYNAVLMTLSELKKHEKMEQLEYPQEIIDRVEAILKYERELEKVRTLYNFS